MFWPGGGGGCSSYRGLFWELRNPVVSGQCFEFCFSGLQWVSIRQRPKLPRHSSWLHFARASSLPHKLPACRTPFATLTKVKKPRRSQRCLGDSRIRLDSELQRPDSLKHRFCKMHVVNEINTEESCVVWTGVGRNQRSQLSHSSRPLSRCVLSRSNKQGSTTTLLDTDSPISSEPCQKSGNLRAIWHTRPMCLL